MAADDRPEAAGGGAAGERGLVKVVTFSAHDLEVYRAAAARLTL
jgi:hypothetical protein